MPNTFDSIAAIHAAEGRDLGVTEWLVVTQQRIDQFADATGDHQWIHVDPARAKDGPFGACIAHGYLTMALANFFLPQLAIYENVQLAINYGADRVRFPTPVKVNSRVRGHGQILRVEDIGGAAQVTVRVTVELEGSERPGCVVDTISRLYFSA